MPQWKDGVKSLAAGTVVAERYEVGEELGRGGMAIVYAARDKVLKRDVALKIVRREALDDPAAPTRMRREARAVGGLRHPHLITFHDVGEHESRPFIVMERLRGRTLAEERDRCRRIDAVRACRLGVQIASALGAAHQAGIIHRDLKPDNVFLVDRGGADFVKLLDFSVAKLPGALIDGRITSSGAVFGTPAYMPPEQAIGDPVSEGSDLYALGALLFELIAGRPPFQAKNVIQLLTLQSTEVAPDLRTFEGDVPPELAELLARMLERKSADRPESAAKVEAILAAVAERLEREGVAPPPLPRPRKKMPSADVTQAGSASGTDDAHGSGVHAPSAVYREVKLDGGEEAKRTPRQTQPRDQPAVPRPHRATALRRTAPATHAAAEQVTGRVAKPQGVERSAGPRTTQPVYPRGEKDS